jgi:hypothetical protein
MSTFITFQIFNAVELAKELTDLLESKGIQYHVEDTSPEALLMPTSNQLPEIRVQLRQNDFERANALLEAIAISNLENIRQDHYLLEFSDDELMEILEKPDEWNKNDIALAKKLLKDRGKEMSPAIVAELQKKRMASLATPDVEKRGWIYFGYFLSLFGSPIGFIMGWDFLSRKKYLPDGRKVYANCTEDRKHGQRILILGVIFTALWIVYFLKLYKII